MNEEEEDREKDEQEKRRERREAEARNQRRQELEARIGLTTSGHNWLRRINQIGKESEHG